MGHPPGMDPPRHHTRPQAEHHDLRPGRPSRRPVERPNYEATGQLAAEHMTRNGVLLKYAEPPESCVPSRRFRFHVFKGDQQICTLAPSIPSLSLTSLAVIPLHARSSFLVGRDGKIADIALHHDSISKQHAVIQHRQLTQRRPDGLGMETLQRPYLIDLESANGTELNGLPVEAGRYYELKVGDVVRFGASTREFVFFAEDALQA